MKASKKTVSHTIEFTKEAPHKAGIYFDQNGELVEIIRNPEIGEWTVADWPHLRCTETWEPGVSQRSTLCIKFPG
ncbi:MAG: hypothetical protein M0R32_02465 [Candidatus Cloacimonetes bacterium]|nr:hypothetical protein [Candidatus Cloacimonadota bacterium]